MNKTKLAQQENDVMDVWPKIYDLFRELLKILNEKGGQHPMVARKNLELSILFNRLGQFEDALKYAGRAVDIYFRAYGMEDPRVEISLRVFTETLCRVEAPERILLMALQ